MTRPTSTAGSRRRRSPALVAGALAVALALSACGKGGTAPSSGSGASQATGGTSPSPVASGGSGGSGGPGGSPSETSSPSGSVAPSASPTGSGTTTTLQPAQDLCPVLKLSDLVAATGLPLQPCRYAGRTSTWQTKGATGVLTVNLQSGEGVFDYIEHLKSGAGTAVDVAGADDAVAVTTPAANGGSRISLIVLIGDVSLNLGLTARHATIGKAVAVAEMVVRAGR